MAALQRVHSSLCTSTGGNSSRLAAQNLVSDHFPAGLRVLVVDDDVITLKILEKMSRRCQYNVTTCSQAAVALNLLRERKGCFDVVLSDVHMPDMDGYKLLEYIGLEMDLPVIMMSADGSTSAVMKGVKHGACDYLIKPVREEEIKNIWQHVVRKRWAENKENENSGNLESNDSLKLANGDVEYTSSANDAADGQGKAPKRKNSLTEDEECEIERENDDLSTSKKPRVVWSVELHQQFFNAVCQLGLDKAVPKRILELMNVPGLTRENVASHLQKFRLYLKRINGVVPQQSEVSICQSAESNEKLGAHERFDLQSLAASGQISPQTLAAIQAELLGRPVSNMLHNDPSFVQGIVQGPKHTAVAYDQPIVRCPPNVLKQSPQSILAVEDASSDYGTGPSNGMTSVGLKSSHGRMIAQNGNTLDMLQQQQKRQFPVPQQHPLINEHSPLINVQPSCLVIPSQISGIFQGENSAASVNKKRSFNTDYNPLSPPQNNSTMHIGQFLGPGFNTGHIPGRHTTPDSVSSAASCSKTNGNFCEGLISSTTGHVPVFAPNMHERQGSLYPRQRSVRPAGFVGNGALTASNFAVNGTVLAVNNLSQGKVSVDNRDNMVKQEENVKINNARSGITALERLESSELMSVFTNR